MKLVMNEYHPGMLDIVQEAFGKEILTATERQVLHLMRLNGRISTDPLTITQERQLSDWMAGVVAQRDADQKARLEGYYKDIGKPHLADKHADGAEEKKSKAA